MQNEKEFIPYQSITVPLTVENYDTVLERSRQYHTDFDVILNAALHRGLNRKIRKKKIAKTPTPKIDMALLVRDTYYRGIRMRSFYENYSFNVLFNAILAEGLNENKGKRRAKTIVIIILLLCAATLLFLLGRGFLIWLSQ